MKRALYEDLEAQQRILTKDRALYDAQHSVFMPRLLSASELQTHVVEAYATFCSLSRSIFLLLKLHLRNAMLRFMGYRIVKEWVRLNGI